MGKPKIKNLRAVDQISFSDKNRKDFSVRKHGISSRQTFELLLIFIGMTAGVAFLLYKKTLMGSIACSLVGILLYTFASLLDTHQKILQGAEFLNALFASVISAGCKFSMIVTEETGQIVYLDNAFQQMFPDMIPRPKRSLEFLLTEYNASAANREAVLQAIKKDEASQVPLKIDGGKEKTSHSVVLSIEPIKRPKGFYMVRGREIS